MLVRTMLAVAGASAIAAGCGAAHDSGSVDGDGGTTAVKIMVGGLDKADLPAGHARRAARLLQGAGP